jgi:hypothetical protein
MGCNPTTKSEVCFNQAVTVDFIAHEHELFQGFRCRLALPVILVSGAMPAGELNRSPWLQVQATLLKPYTLAELFRTVREVLRTAGSTAREQFAPPSNWQSLPSTVSLWL